jgi:hypothetical protein
MEGQNMSNNDPGRPPFRDHPLYYPILKIVVLACGLYFALRIFGVL